MRYVSNLKAPDLAPYFKLRQPPIQLLGHDMPSDPDFEPDCGYWTHDEAAILFHVVHAAVGGHWLDIGSRMGWTTAHMAITGIRQIVAIDQAYDDAAFIARFDKNLIDVEMLGGFPMRNINPTCLPSQEYLVLCDKSGTKYDGFVIDACHDSPEPLNDAKGCAAIAKPDAVILLHDAWGWPVQDGAQWLMDHGWRVRLYNTPNGVLLCWRDPAFTAPYHVPDPAVDWEQQRRRITNLDLARCV